MNVKPKIGILFLTSGWFRDVGLQISSSHLTEEVDEIAKEIVQRLSRFLVPVCKGVLFSENEAKNAAEEIRTANVDGIIVAPLMWCEDQILRAALKVIPNLPLIVCTFFPSEGLSEFVSYHEMIKGSGLVGNLQMSGLLKRDGYLYQSVSGYYRDPGVYEEIKEHCFALAISRNLKNVRCGVLPFRCEAMSTTYIDEFAIRKLYGIELKYLELQRFKEEAQKVSPDEINQFKKIIKDEGQVVEVDQKNLTEGIKYAIALEKVISDERIGIFVMNDVIDEMHVCFGLRPCLTNPRLSASGVVVTMEADIAAGIAMYILRLFTGKSPFYAELYTADLEKNAFLMGHPGYHDSINHDEKYPVKIVPDVEYENSDPFSGACTFFKYKPGPVTVVNSVYNGKKLRWTVFEGYSLQGPPKMEGSCHLFCKIETPIKELCNRAIQIGVSQHWIVVPGHFMKNFEKLCRWLNIEYCAVD
jgi:L-fucose isomerase-like protein